MNTLPQEGSPMAGGSHRVLANRQRRGFALLMSLVLILLCAILLAGLARYSLSMASDCHEARRELQRHWGTVSLSRTVLTQAQQIVAEHVQDRATRPEDQSPLFPIEETVRLGELDFHVLLDDESRKLNLNRLYLAGGSGKVYEALQGLRQSRAALRLRPHPDHVRNVTVRPFESWGQVYRLDELPTRQHPARWLATAAEEVTCWGDGRVHYRFCSDPVLEIVAREAAGPVTAGRLLRLRSEEPLLELDELLSRLALRQRENYRLRSWLTDQSGCYSAWITVEGPGRAWHELLLAELTPSESLEIHHFTW